MSNPDLHLEAHCSATLDDVGKELGLDFNLAKSTDFVDQMKLDQMLGFIWVKYIQKWRWNYGPYKENWNLSLSFGSGIQWSELRDALVLHLYSWLVADHPGTYLGWYDTGEVLFYSKNGNLIINSKRKERLSRVAFPTIEFTFGDLKVM